MSSVFKFIESLCFENGQYPFLSWHQRRLNQAFKSHFPDSKPHSLCDILPQINERNRYKVRVEYDSETCEVDYAPYRPKQVSSLQLVLANEINYPHKYADRSELTALYKKRQQADDILIVKNELITDSYYANVAFWDGSDWFTPDTCLLNGVKRQYLLASNIIAETRISVNDLKKFEKISLINAMLDLDEVEIEVSKISY